MLPHEKEHERQAFREMSFGKKLEHFKTYYALPVGIVAAILILGIVLISRIFFHPEETHIFSAAVFEEYFDDDAKAAFTEKIKTLLHSTGKHDVVRVDDAYSITSSNDRVRISVMVAANEYDLIIAGETFFRELAGIGYFADLDQYMNEKEAAAFSTKLVKAPGRLSGDDIEDQGDNTIGKGEEKNYGLSLKDSDLWKEVSMFVEDPVAGLVEGAPDANNAMLVLDALLSTDAGRQPTDDTSEE